MKRFCFLCANEARLLGYSAVSHVGAAAFLFTMGFLFLFLLEEYTRFGQSEPLALAFFKAFWIPSLLVIPALTASLFAERLGDRTFASLRVLPIRLSSLLLSDWLVAYAYYLALWAIALLFPWMTQLLFPEVAQSWPFFPLSWALGGYAFIALSGGFFIAIGLFCSSLMGSSLVSGVLSFGFLLAHFLSGEGLRQLEALRGKPFAPSFLSPDFYNVFLQMEDFCRGIVDTRVLIFYLAGTFFFLFLAQLLLERHSV
jgi:ABC-2 type transport system permease protein